MMTRGTVSLPPCCPGFERGVSASPTSLGVNGWTPIIGLLRCGCPSTIRWHVARVIVNAVYAVLGRGTGAHIGNEMLKRCSPMVANMNTSSAVTLIGVIRRVVAPLNHVVPHAVLRSLRTAMAEIQRAYALENLAFPTPATCDIAITDTSNHGFKLIPTVAGEHVIGTAVRCDITQSKAVQPPDILSREVDTQGHGDIIQWGYTVDQNMKHP